MIIQDKKGNIINVEAVMNDPSDTEGHKMIVDYIKEINKHNIMLRLRAGAALSDLTYLLTHQKTNMEDGSELMDGQSACELQEVLQNQEHHKIQLSSAYGKVGKL